ncbi:T9SS type A sorting domain-containing protein [Ferruginibacter sp. HRS2-29]|uniref:T9SS type A sorting domain-containing protein n=1 Tax=Ferruginibacter sp. HRS2-29 TaxID=2487334 RepID=UPI0020CD0D2A|nr:T9SS type A sorting domain-containing protein [Ferruginibacter sp. HRS2-29]MCP9752024.1 T9SS C-terminal target domain-containing protein [Ferruginibacter sp. HRS2-29]
MKQLMIFVWLWGSGITVASAQNNTIFGGGNADGWDKTSFQQASNNIFTGGNGDGISITLFAQAGNNIFTGGNGDGWDKTSFAQAGNNIFTGSAGDGWSSTSFAQPANAIFGGGIGDGWDKTSYAQPLNAIFGGGAGDGWDKTSFAQPENNIFFGGVGDGWASAYRPQGPLPVTFEYFTATKLNTPASLLKWKTAQELNSATFEIERSSDALTFAKIGSVAAAGNSNTAIEYSFTDNAPIKGLNYYRIKQIDLDGHFVYTPTRVINFDQLNAGSLSYYPNPTAGLLNIKLTEALQKEPKVINIFNAAGMVVNQLKIAANSNSVLILDLSKYARGTYFIQVRTAMANSTERIVLQ